ncbi:hypothetical protein STRIP9103_02449 [Streptomyces ipomoeae 91-03]|uniref:Uncharacterized protein n=1 Tax=Streptomyces ipomoeae 91-03 TaxID=698759 RepID=L1KPL2_9ACTN|nr:hypothetical protein STRIP9103_02449 [Streptomyces ipomoeae 91-03]
MSMCGSAAWARATAYNPRLARQSQAPEFSVPGPEAERLRDHRTIRSFC